MGSLELSFYPVCGQFAVELTDLAHRHQCQFEAAPDLGSAVKYTRAEGVVVGHVAVTAVEEVDEAVVGAAFLEGELGHAGQGCVGIALVPLHDGRASQRTKGGGPGGCTRGEK